MLHKCEKIWTVSVRDPILGRIGVLVPDPGVRDTLLAEHAQTSKTTRNPPPSPCAGWRRLLGAWLAAGLFCGREIAAVTPSNDFQRFATVSNCVLRGYGTGECAASLHRRPVAPHSDRDVLKIHIPSPASACDAWGSPAC